MAWRLYSSWGDDQRLYIGSGGRQWGTAQPLVA
jgi:hypothetical protein